MSPAAQPLRVVDAGTVGAWRSQALWHGIASALSRDAPPTLSFCRPGEAYVGLGFHRALAEIDQELCRREGLPVIRRQIGGGPVWIDSDQLFFQVTLPARSAPLRVDRLYEACLGPAVAAFRRLGLDARLEGLNEITVAGRRLSGTGAGRIGHAVTVVGNVIFRFPHERMAAVLALPDEATRAECLRLMRRQVSSLAGEGLTEISFDQARDALVEAYSEGLGRTSEVEEPRADEEEAIRDWERRFADPRWLAGRPAAAGPARQVKIAAGVWVTAIRLDGLEALVSVAGGRIERAALRASGVNGDGGRMALALAGRRADPEALRSALEPFGEDGSRVRDAILPALTLR